MYERKLSMSEFPIPESDNLEIQVLSGLVGEPDNIYIATKLLKTEYFSNPSNVKAWEIVLDMERKNEVINLATVMPRFEKDVFNKIMNNVGKEFYGREYEAICKCLIECYIKRTAYFSAIDLLQKATAQNISTDELIENVGKLNVGITKATETSNTKSLTDVINTLAEDLQNGNQDIVPTGIPSLDSALYGGLRKGNLVVLAARPSVGKTAVALYMARYASQFGFPAFIASLEMTQQELAQRFLTATEIITPYQIATRAFSWENFEKAASKYNNTQIFINDKMRTLDRICAEIRAQVRAKHCKIAFIDYLGLIKTSMAATKYNLVQALGEITSDLKNLAKELNIPIVLLCQLNRMSVSQNRAPELYDLRDSGSIEQDSDIVLMLERPRNNLGDEMEDQIIAWVRKNRNGKRDFGIQLAHNSTHTVYNEVGIIR